MEAMHVPAAELLLVRTADMRYAGQFHEVEVPMASGPLDQEQVRDAVARFHRRHHELYNFSMGFRAVEFLNFRVKATARRASFALEEIPAVTGTPRAP